MRKRSGVSESWVTLVAARFLAAAASLVGSVSSAGPEVAAPMPKVGLVAVKLNGSLIPPTANLAAIPGDVIESEIRISGWGAALPSGMRSYSAKTRGRVGVVSGGNSTVFPVGWEAALDPAVCSTAATCAPDEVCSGICVRPNHNPALGAFIDAMRTDFVFAALTSLPGVGVGSLDYTYFGLSLDAEGALDTGTAAYGGTLRLVVSPHACGTFLFALDCADTFLASPENVLVAAELFPLTIQMGVCPVLPLVSSPPSCAVDARMPHARGAPSTALGWSSMDLHFDASPSGLTTAAFAPFVTPPPTSWPITSLTAAPSNTLRIGFSGVIPSEAWTCVEHLASGRTFCMGRLPADADQNLVAEAADLTALALNLKGRTSPPMATFQCDLDRSGRCTPVDILAGAELLLGSGFEPWYGAAIGVDCPAMPWSAPAPSEGACCDTRSGSCMESVPKDYCADVREIWTGGAHCCAVSCHPILGACCDTRFGQCSNGVPQVNCRDAGQQWHPETSCRDVVCPRRGACCNLETTICVDDVAQAACESDPPSRWYSGLRCSQIICEPG